MASQITFDVLARDRASKTFDHVGRSAEGLSARAVAIGTFVGGAALKGVGALGRLAAAGAKMGLSVAAGNEQAMISFETMLGSASKARAFLGELQQFAAATPFEFPELQSAASSLISAGINANKVIPIMRTLGDVTSGMGTGSEGVQRATIALQQMSAAGRITGEDLNQLRDAGIPVYDLLAKATGKSKAEVVKLAQAGRLGSKELGQMMKALETGKGLERFSGLMDKQSQSLSGMWSTMKDTIGQGLAKAIAPSLPLLKILLQYGSELGNKVFAKIGQVLPPVVQAIEDMVGGLTLSSDSFASLGDGAGKWVARGQKARTVATQVAAVLGRMASWLKANAGWIKEVVIFVGTFIAAFKILTAIVRAYIAVQAIFNAVLTANPIGIVIVALAALVAGLVYAYRHSETFRKIVDGAFKVVATSAKFLWNNAIKPYFRLIAALWLTVAGVIIHGAAAAFGWIPGIGPKVRKMADQFDELKRRINGALAGVKDKKVYVSAPGASKTIQQLADLRWQASRIPRSVTIGVNNKLAGMRAAGGPVGAGLSYLVGERGPEIFTPNAAGNITPNHRLGGGGPPVVIQINGALDPLAVGKQVEAVLLRVKQANGGRPLAFS